MNSMINTSPFQEKIGQTLHLMEQAGHSVAQSSARLFSDTLGSLTGWDSFRINPAQFAQQTGMDLDEAVGLFVYGAKSGLLHFEWNLLCPYCGGREHSHANLDHMEKETYHCTLCDRDLELVADDHLEVSFTINPAISGFYPDPLKSQQDYFAYHFSRHLIRHPKLVEVFEAQPPLRFVVIPPGATAKIKCGPVPSRRHRILSLESHTIYNMYMGEGEESSNMERLKIEHDATGFSRKSDTVSGSNAELLVRNSGDKSFGLIAVAPDSESILRAATAYPNSFVPFVTGKYMLNNQYFRELFLVDNLPDNLSLRLNDMTLMFTDLRGSTALYEKTGDVRAYRLVKDHFAILNRIVRLHQGAIVKTMGDAIMASFNDPIAGLRAASAMLVDISEYNQAKGADLLGLKIGLHRGPVIAVKANQTLDYFGQTVNLAARIQGLAESGEIWLSNEMLRDVDHVADGFRVENRQVSLKGISDQMSVYRMVMG